MVTVVMYHYVRDLANSRYPFIKGLDLRLFQKQIKYLMSNYTLIRIEQLIDAAYGSSRLPKNSALLTFDDAYIDHYLNVFPILDYHNIQGVFYAPVEAITQNKVLDVNKIHFILATSSSKEIIDNIKDLLKHYKHEKDILTFDDY